MNKIWLIIICFSLIYGMFTGRGADLSNVILNVPRDAFELLITMITAACFWSGMIMNNSSIGTESGDCIKTIRIKIFVWFSKI